MQNTSLYTLTWYSMVSTENKIIQNVKKKFTVWCEGTKSAGTQQ